VGLANPVSGSARDSYRMMSIICKGEPNGNVHHRVQ